MGERGKIHLKFSHGKLSKTKSDLRFIMGKSDIFNHLEIIIPGTIFQV